MQTVAKLETTCKCCGGPSPLYGVCDLSKSCLESQNIVRPLVGIPVYYHKCAVCHFIFTRDFDEFTEADFSREIYNDQYIEVDPDFVEIRPAATADVIANCFGEARADIRILDYGGGDGKMGAHLREKNFKHVEIYDPFSDNFRTVPEGKFDLIVSFEVAEHVIDPKKEFGSMRDMLTDPGLLIFTTLITPADIDIVRTNHWYIAPRNGHVCMYSEASLRQIFEGLGMNFLSLSQVLHAALFAEVPDFAKHMFSVVNVEQD